MSPRIVIFEDKSQSKDDPLESSDKDVVVGLLALGYNPSVIEWDREMKVIYYIFDRKKAQEDYDHLDHGIVPSIPYDKVIDANKVWAKYLTRANRLNTSA